MQVGRIIEMYGCGDIWNMHYRGSFIMELGGYQRVLPALQHRINLIANSSAMNYH